MPRMRKQESKEAILGVLNPEASRSPRGPDLLRQRGEVRFAPVRDERELPCRLTRERFADLFRRACSESLKGGATMGDDLSDIAKAMQDELNSVFSETVIDHAMNPRNVGRIEDEDGFAVFTGSCGDTMMVSVKISDGRIAEARFWTDGCGTSIASGSMVTEMAKGRTLDEAMEVGQAEVLEELNGLPEESEHCALLAATTLHMAVEAFLEKGKKMRQTDRG